MKTQGKFIVIEGIDGSGTTTQAQMLKDYLTSVSLPVHSTREPSDGPVGAMIRQALTHRLVCKGASMQSVPPDWRTMSLLFAADRTDHLQNEIIPNLLDAVHVVTDRYDLSSYTYQSLISPEHERLTTLAWLRAINMQARRPDLVLVLDVEPDLAARRRAKRGGSPELYEVDELQRMLADAYKVAEYFLPNDNVVHVDANRNVGEIFHDVRRAALGCINGYHDSCEVGKEAQK